MKLPRKLKKQLKKSVLKDSKEWKTSEVRIDRIEKSSINLPYLFRCRPYYKATQVKSFRLI